MCAMIENFTKHFAGKIATLDECCEYMIDNLRVDPKAFLSENYELASLEPKLTMTFKCECSIVVCEIVLLRGVGGVKYIHFLGIVSCVNNIVP